MDAPDAPERLRTLPSWLINQVAAVSHRLVAENLRHTHSAHRHHYAVLAALAEGGPSSQADLGRRIGLDRSDVTAAVNLLEEHGMLERTPDPADRRRNLVSLTPAGVAHLAEVDAVIGAAQDDLLAPLTDADRAALIQLLRRIAAHHGALTDTSEH